MIEFISACGFMVALYFGVKHGMKPGLFVAMGALHFSWRMSRSEAQHPQCNLENGRLLFHLNVWNRSSMPKTPCRNLRNGRLSRANEIVFEQVGFYL